MGKPVKKKKKAVKKTTVKPKEFSFSKYTNKLMSDVSAAAGRAKQAISDEMDKRPGKIVQKGKNRSKKVEATAKAFRGRSK